MIAVGFSTQTKNPLSAIIRFFTGSPISHTWLLVEDPVFGMKMVMEADEFGIRLIPYDRFQLGNDIKYLITLNSNWDYGLGLATAGEWLSSMYDFSGLIGMAFVVIGRWLKRKWNNPFASHSAMFCSELVVRFLQASQYPGTKDFVPEDTTPQDLLTFLQQPPVATGIKPEVHKLGS